MGVACCANYPASQSIRPNSQTVTCSCAESSSTSPPIARPSKTQGRATQDKTLYAGAVLLDNSSCIPFQQNSS